MMEPWHPAIETQPDPTMGGWVARIYEQPGIVGQGETRIEAIKEALNAWKEALNDEHKQEWLKDLMEHEGPAVWRVGDNGRWFNNLMSHIRNRPLL